MKQAKLIKREQTMPQNNHSQLGTQGPALKGIAAIRTEVQARMTTPEREKQEQARRNFNDLFA